MPAESQRTIHDIWLHDDTEEDLVGADWHQRAIVNLYASLVDLATQQGWPWHVGNQLPLVGWRRDGTSWRPSPDIMIHPQAGPALREEMSVRDDGPPALIIEVASASTWRYDVDRDDGKPAGYLHLGVPEYLVFDPTGTNWGVPCHGWRREGETVQEWRPTADGRYHCTSLGISFGPDGDLLRVFDPEGRPVAYIHEKSQEIAEKLQEIAERNRRLAVLEEELRRLRGV